MFLSLPTTVDKIHRGDGHEDHHGREDEGTFHHSNPKDCLRRAIGSGRYLRQIAPSGDGICVTIIRQPDMFGSPHRCKATAQGASYLPTNSR